MIKQYLLGDIDPAFFSACFIAGLVGVLFILLLGTGLRQKDSPNSPVSFSWSYLWSDNLKRILLSVLTVLISIRFLPDLLNWELTIFNAFCIGVSWDAISLLIKQKTSFLDPK